jgi:DNA-binding transcriptional regulator YhcF (GntR family)
MGAQKSSFPELGQWEIFFLDLMYTFIHYWRRTFCRHAFRFWPWGRIMNATCSTSLRRSWRLDHGSALPMHRQAGQLLRDLILRQEYQSGALLPEEVTLAARLGISRGTLRLAIGRLVHDGLLERRAAVGTRVRPQPAESGIGAGEASRWKWRAKAFAWKITGRISF